MNRAMDTPSHPSFGQWFHRKSLAVLGVVGTFGAAEFLSFAKDLKELLPATSNFPAWATNGPFLVDSLTTLALLVLNFVSLTKPKIHERTPYLRASLVTMQFHGWWAAQWFAWLLFYVAQTAHSFFRIGVAPSDHILHGTFEIAWNIGLDTLSNIQTGIFIIAYLVLSRDTAKEAANRRLESTLYWVPVFAVILVISIGQLLILFALDTALRLPAYHICQLITGFASAVGMALFIGRFESRLFNIETLYIALLYFYASLQVLFGAFEFSPPASPLGTIPAIETFAVAAALPLKLLLFLVVHWALTTGEVLFYCQRARHLLDTLEEEWRAFDLNVNSKTEPERRV